MSALTSVVVVHRRLDYLHYVVSAAFRTARSLTKSINRVVKPANLCNYKKNVGMQGMQVVGAGIMRMEEDASDY